MFAFILLLILFSYFFLNKKGKDTELDIKENVTINNQIEIKEEKNIKGIEVEKVLNENKLSYELKVLDKSYISSFNRGDTLEVVMEKLEQERDDFSFKVSKHSSLGSFVEEINNIRGSIGKYFIYYVNGEMADVGISKYVLKEGDIINWKLE